MPALLPRISWGWLGTVAHRLRGLPPQAQPTRFFRPFLLELAVSSLPADEAVVTDPLHA